MDQKEQRKEEPYCTDLHYLKLVVVAVAVKLEDVDLGTEQLEVVVDPQIVEDIPAEMRN